MCTPWPYHRKVQTVTIAYTVHTEAIAYAVHTVQKAYTIHTMAIAYELHRVAIAYPLYSDTVLALSCLMGWTPIYLSGY